MSSITLKYTSVITQSPFLNSGQGMTSATLLKTPWILMCTDNFISMIIGTSEQSSMKYPSFSCWPSDAVKNYSHLKITVAYHEYQASCYWVKRGTWQSCFPSTSKSTTAFSEVQMTWGKGSHALHASQAWLTHWDGAQSTAWTPFRLSRALTPLMRQFHSPWDLRAWQSFLLTKMDFLSSLSPSKFL